MSCSLQLIWSSQWVRLEVISSSVASKAVSAVSNASSCSKASISAERIPLSPSVPSSGYKRKEKRLQEERRGIRGEKELQIRYASIRGEKRLQEERRDNESYCTWWQEKAGFQWGGI